ncbi:unnamed protein product, partial [Heterotrigona itama]
MSLVAYESSDESSDDEGNDTEIKNKFTPEVTVLQISDKLLISKHNISVDNENDINIEPLKANGSSEKLHFDKLPKPKSLISETKNIVEDDILPKKKTEFKFEKPVKKDRIPVKITVPSLSEKGTKLLVLLPPPKRTEVKNTNNLVPSVVNKAAKQSNQIIVQPNKDTHIKDSNTRKSMKPITTRSSISCDSNSEDEDDMIIGSDSNSIADFFALTTTDASTLSDSLNVTDLNNFDSEFKKNSQKDNTLSNYFVDNSDITETEISTSKSQTTLVSNVINLPKEEILLKNKAEVGPKLPVPEQEYNVDSEGNVAFDDKAIEYLCGKRGVKRKPKEIEEMNIIEINGEDIKPDEREWLVKALTEEPVQRPISMQGGGVSSQSKKKHQITYLAHQAKAMEMELKNQWAQNRLTRKQTQSKY